MAAFWSSSSFLTVALALFKYLFVKIPIITATITILGSTKNEEFEFHTDGNDNGNDDCNDDIGFSEPSFGLSNISLGCLRGPSRPSS